MSTSEPGTLGLENKGSPGSGLALSDSGTPCLVCWGMLRKLLWLILRSPMLRSGKDTNHNMAGSCMTMAFSFGEFGPIFYT